jgi:hypothetical protein
MIALQKESLSSPDLTRLRGRSRFGLAKARRSITFHKIRFFQMDARVKPAHDGVAGS